MLCTTNDKCKAPLLDIVSISYKNMVCSIWPVPNITYKEWAIDRWIISSSRSFVSRSPLWVIGKQLIQAVASVYNLQCLTDNNNNHHFPHDHSQLKDQQKHFSSSTCMAYWNVFIHGKFHSLYKDSQWHSLYTVSSFIA